MTKVTYVSDDATKPFRLTIGGKGFKFDLVVLGKLIDSASDAMDQYMIDRGGEDPRTRKFTMI